MLLQPSLTVASTAVSALKNSDQSIEQFVLALDAYRNNEWQKGQQHHQSLVNLEPNYPLLGYLEYHKIRQQFPDADIKRVQQFINKHQANPLANQMRSLALHQYASIRKWPEFLAVSQGVPGEPILRCNYYRAMLQTDSKRGLEEAQKLFLSGKSKPDACDPLFSALDKAGLMTDGLIWQRLELAYASNSPGLMRYLRGQLSQTKLKQKAGDVIALHRHPETVLHSSHQFSNTLTMAILKRLAKREPDSFWAQINSLEKKFSLSQTQLSTLKASAAWSAVINGGPSKHNWLDGYLQAHGSDAALEQRARIAVRQQDWTGLSLWISKMSAKQQSETNWLYWRARIAQEQGQQQESSKWFAKAAKKRSFWGFLAAEHLGITHPLAQQTITRSSHTFDSNTLETLQRIDLLRQAEEATHARLEWLMLLRQASPETQLALAQHASDNDWPHLAVESAIFARQWNRLDWRFPTALFPQFSQVGQLNGVDPLLLMSVSRRESAFNPHAKSHVGARGLMQLMPATARQVARTMGSPKPKADELKDIQLNLSLGSRYLADLLQRYQGNRVLSLAAYNAGPHRVDKWLERQPVPFDAFIEGIPFRETREYVQAVLAYRVIFSHLLGNPQIKTMGRHETGILYGPLQLAQNPKP